MSSGPVMQTRYLEAFEKATVDTLSTMCGLTATRTTDFYRKEGVFPTCDVVVVMGFSGALRGAVILTMPIDVAQGMVGAFVGEPVTAVGPELTDGLAEILNIVVGAATAEVPELKSRLSLPTVLVGQNQRLTSKQNAPWYVIPLRLPECGEFNLQISMTEP